MPITLKIITIAVPPKINILLSFAKFPKAAVILDFSVSFTFMSSFDANKFRRVGNNIKVTKNRLTKLALEGTDKSELSELFDGPTAIAYSNDPVELTKLLTNFAKNNSNLVILGGIMDNEILTVEKIEILSKLPSLEEIRAQLIGLISTPAQKIASVLTAPSGDLARVFNAYSTK